jgi:hypothetical protein
MNMSKLDALLQHTVTRFAKYPGGWVCASTDLPLRAFVDACKGDTSFTAEIQDDDYWCVIRPIIPNQECGGIIIWRSDYGTPRTSDLQELRERFFSYVKQQEEAQ